jgi:dephospho-CoA kinase
MLRVGLTGGIAVGKSTVAAMLAKLGVVVIDADLLVHELMAPGGNATLAVVARFGDAIQDGSGGIDRERLGRIVFSDPSARRDLESIIHPLVRSEATVRFAQAARERGYRIGLFDAALLVETGTYRDFDKLIVVRCSPETQIERLTNRDGLAEEHARSRIAAQAPLEEKLAVADYVIDAGGTREATDEQAIRLFRKLEEDWRRLGAPP